MLTLFICLSCLFFITTILLSLVIIGFMRTEKFIKDNYEQKVLSGVEIETIRRKVITAGVNSISNAEIYNLIYTIRQIFYGKYVDKDPYIPADTYDDVAKKIDEI